MNNDTADSMISADTLEKIYGETTAVDGISFDVEEGEIFGLLGPNGAGKTTTVNMLTTLVSPTAGSARVNGFDVRTEPRKVRDSIGVVFQETALDDWLTGRENMVFHARMYGIGKQERQRRIEELFDLVDLTDAADKQVEQYSGGMKRKLEIARGLLHEPEVLFLDEPTLGLDAEVRRAIWQYVDDLNEDKDMTIVLTTHYMEEADYLCDRTAIMQDGHIQALDTPAALKEQLGGRVIRLTVGSGAQAIAADLKEQDWVENIEESGDGGLSVTSERPEDHIGDLMDIIEAHGTSVRSLDLRQPSLEDVFLHVTQDKETYEDLMGDRR